ncbi:hypothetical protein [Streptomyces sp. NPDC050504]|uniref:hypothetical protein n=1 Tax=Streptomyces sp. NPDC050504 TaxID=3365618 RepID=UPI0037A56F4B
MRGRGRAGAARLWALLAALLAALAGVTAGVLGAAAPATAGGPDRVVAVETGTGDTKLLGQRDHREFRRFLDLLPPFSGAAPVPEPKSPMDYGEAQVAILVASGQVLVDTFQVFRTDDGRRWLFQRDRPAWYRAPAELVGALDGMGLLDRLETEQADRALKEASAEDAPRSGPSGPEWWWSAIPGAGLGVAAGAAGGVLAIRRRWTEAP